MPRPAQFPLEPADFSSGLRHRRLKLPPHARTKGNSAKLLRAPDLQSRDPGDQFGADLYVSVWCRRNLALQIQETLARRAKSGKLSRDIGSRFVPFCLIRSAKLD